MAKILIVGHQHSNYQAVEQLLYSHGMGHALPSKRDGMSPLEIDSLLARSARPSLYTPRRYETEQQLHIEAAWYGLAMDLFLGNIDQPFWGWADPEANSLLNYWRDIDSSMHFILVYDQPNSVLTRAPQMLTESVIAQKLQEWLTYNESLLNFYLHNKNRCLLIHSQQAQLSIKKYLKKISHHIGAQWTTQENKSHKQPQLFKPSKDKNFELSVHTENNGQTNLAAYLADALIHENVDVIELYKKLQDNSNLPLKSDLCKKNNRQLVMGAWQTMMLQHQEIASLMTNSLADKDNISLLSKQLQSTKKECENIHLHYNQVEEQLKATRKIADEYKQKHDIHMQEKLKLEKEKSDLASKIDLFTQQAEADKQNLQQLKNTQSSIEKENSLLLEQLHFVQEELEKIYLEKQRLTARPVYYGAADRVRSQLPYQLGAVMIQQSKSFSGCIKMPFELLRTAKRVNKEQQTCEQNLPPVHFYNDASDIDRIHKHLSYQLGQNLLTYIRNPLRWLAMPFVLANTARKFKKQKSTNKFI